MILRTCEFCIIQPKDFRKQFVPREDGRAAQKATEGLRVYCYKEEGCGGRTKNKLLTFMTIYLCQIIDSNKFL